jgi:hypothetical protein
MTTATVHAFEQYDPLTRTMLHEVEVLSEISTILRDRFDFPPKPTPKDRYRYQSALLLAFNVALTKLLDFTDDCRYPELGTDGVEHLFQNIDQLLDLFENAKCLLEDGLKEARSEHFAALHRSELQASKERQDSLRSQVKRLTVAHVALQSHFTLATLFGPPASRELKAELYSTLSKLRDEYFLNPDAEVLAEYLKAFEEVVAQPRYSSYRASEGSPGPERLKLKKVRDELTLQLEVESLLGTVNYS